MLIIAGIRRGIHYTWAFMLVGQIVAVSFATNLFFITLLLSPSASNPTHPTTTARSRGIVWFLNITAVLGTTIPAFLMASEHYWHHPTDFLPVILSPHIALLALPFTRIILPTKYFADGDLPFKDNVFDYMSALALCNAGIMLLKTTWTAYSYAGFTGIESALLEHPAVSNIAFDVILCWITWVCWFAIQRGSEHPVGKFLKHS